jgi:hypothetical protein
MEKWKFLTLAGHELRPLGRPARRKIEYEKKIKETSMITWKKERIFKKTVWIPPLNVCNFSLANRSRLGRPSQAYVAIPYITTYSIGSHYFIVLHFPGSAAEFNKVYLNLTNYILMFSPLRFVTSSQEEFHIQISYIRLHFQPPPPKTSV